ncbi:hypothetical protein J6590_023205 [Homalodisca vitripennis]|nr:hypothetical protein J6590_023205 [Homalodisca vitripennis]
MARLFGCYQLLSHFGFIAVLEQQHLRPSITLRHLDRHKLLRLSNIGNRSLPTNNHPVTNSELDTNSPCQIEDSHTLGTRSNNIDSPIDFRLLLIPSCMRHLYYLTAYGTICKYMLFTWTAARPSIMNATLF